MSDNLPTQEGVDDKKLKGLENELQEIEKRAQKELQGQKRQQVQQTPENVGVSPQTQGANTPQNQAVDSVGGQQKPSEAPVPTPPASKPVAGKPNGGFKVVMWIALALFVLALLGVVGYFFGKFTPTEETVSTPVPVETAIPTLEPTAAWETYTNETLGFSIRHPEDVKVDEDLTNEVVGFYRLGPTQREQTSLYDGISLAFRSGLLEGKTLKQFVDSKIEEIRTDEVGVAEVTKQLQSVTIAGLPGYEFEVEGLGVFTYYYLPREEGGYFQIIDATKDPTGMGFEETVNLMFSTIKIQVISSSPSATPTSSPSATLTP